MKVAVGILCIFMCICDSKSFIVPDELPSILSVIYSNIPTLKKGTDSRIGWGFRLGNRADFQVMVELGPQLNTQPLGNQGGGDNANKRNTINNLANTLYAKRQQEKKEKQQVVEVQNTPKSEGQKWLQAWSKKTTTVDNESRELPKPKPGIAIGEIDAKSVIPEDIDDTNVVNTQTLLPDNLDVETNKTNDIRHY
ncbi:snustorr snarlik isoform X1 [Rhynchophorus ferrugineus]|uniref:snustorr snarlik isoform X1 n=1 Tax=Rhynchophorus ferrugineus TaxID=354439 RepID=UPI003FCE980B